MVFFKVGCQGDAEMQEPSREKFDEDVLGNVGRKLGAERGTHFPSNCWLSARHCAEHLRCISFLNPHTNPEEHYRSLF